MTYTSEEKLLQFCSLTKKPTNPNRYIALPKEKDTRDYTINGRTNTYLTLHYNMKFKQTWTFRIIHLNYKLEIQHYYESPVDSGSWIYYLSENEKTIESGKSKSLNNILFQEHAEPRECIEELLFFLGFVIDIRKELC